MTPEKDKSKDNTLIILTGPEATTAGIGDLLRPANVPVKKLKDNLLALNQKLAPILKSLPQVGDYELTELMVNVNVTAGGELQLVGFAGAKGQVQGGLTLKFSKRSPEL